MILYPGERARHLLDGITRTLMDRGLYVSRHSYSFRIMVDGRMIMGIHFYPVEREVEIRLYGVYREYGERELPVVLDVIGRFLPGFKVTVKHVEPVVAL